MSDEARTSRTGLQVLAQHERAEVTRAGLQVLKQWQEGRVSRVGVQVLANPQLAAQHPLMVPHDCEWVHPLPIVVDALGGEWPLRVQTSGRLGVGTGEDRRWFAFLDELPDNGNGADLSDADPEPLGTPDSGESGEASRSDHVHKMPDAGDVGADPAGTASSTLSDHESAGDPHPQYLTDAPSDLDDLGDVDAPDPSDGDALVWNASEERWEPGEVAKGNGNGADLSDTDPEPLGTADPGQSNEVSRADHVHPFDPDEPQPYVTLKSPDDGSLWRVQVAADGTLDTEPVADPEEDDDDMPRISDAPTHRRDDAKPVATDPDPELDD